MIECNEFGSKELGKPMFAESLKKFNLFFQINRTAIATVRTFEMTGFVNT